MFGSWVRDIDLYSQKFQTGEPFEHVVIDNFFDPEYAEELYKKFPDKSNPAWFHYNNPIEKKFALNNFKEEPLYAELFSKLQTDDVVGLLKRITMYGDLEADPHLHGAGVHYHPRGGKLDMHLDYSIHPISGKERRVNLIIYMNKNWKEEYNGDIQFWDANFTGPVQRIYPGFNRAVIFRTSDISYHGIPTPIDCPEDTARKSIAIYYVSDARTGTTQRLKAQYRPLPSQPVDMRLKQLYEIRVNRLITKDDLQTIYPDWENNGNGYW